MSEAYRTIPAFTCTLQAGLWTQTPCDVADFLCMGVDEAAHSLRTVGHALVSGGDVLAVRRMVGAGEQQAVTHG